MFISVNPSYLCNFRCSFCYLTKEQLADTKKIELDQLMGLLYEIKHYKSEEEFIFDLYGGEISILPDDYVDSLISILSLFTREPIRITTNLSRIPLYFYDERVQIAVSYDMNARERHGAVYNNMWRFGENKQFDILMLASKQLMEWDPAEILKSLNYLPGLRSIEVKPYSPNQANKHEITNRDFELFMEKLITVYRGHPIQQSVSLQNINQILSVLRSERSSFSDDHVYITPSARFALLDFDTRDQEFFLEVEGFAEVLDWQSMEKHRVSANPGCSSCDYYGRCLSEHLRPTDGTGESCSGFKGLIKWYEQIQKDK